MTSAEVVYYIGYRTEAAGGDRSLFSKPVCNIVGYVTKGIPRLVNILCHKMLLQAYGEGKTTVTLKHAITATLDTEDCKYRVVPRQWHVVALCAGIVIGAAYIASWGGL